MTMGCWLHFFKAICQMGPLTYCHVMRRTRYIKALELTSTAPSCPGMTLGEFTERAVSTENSTRGEPGWAGIAGG